MLLLGCSRSANSSDSEGRLGWRILLYGILVGLASGHVGQQLAGTRSRLHAQRRGRLPRLASFGRTCKPIRGIAESEGILEFDTYGSDCHE